MKLVKLIVPYMSVLIYPCDGITGEGTVSQEYGIVIVLILTRMFARLFAVRLS